MSALYSWLVPRHRWEAFRKTRCSVFILYVSFRADRDTVDATIPCELHSSWAAAQLCGYGNSVASRAIWLRLSTFEQHRV